MALLSALSEHSDKTCLCPGATRFTAKIGLDRSTPALGLSSLDREIGIRRALITGHHRQFETKGLLKKSGEIIRCRAEARGGALGRLYGIAEVQQCFVWCVRPDIENPIRLLRGADPAVFEP